MWSKWNLNPDLPNSRISVPHTIQHKCRKLFICFGNIFNDKKRTT